MTFLEYICRELLGPPRFGERQWHCPFCDPGKEQEWVSFSVRPPKGNYPIKYCCHRCHRWGDEHDLVRHLDPSLSYEARRLWIERLLVAYQRDTSPLGKDKGEPHHTIAQRGCTRSGLAAYLRSKGIK